MEKWEYLRVTLHDNYAVFWTNIPIDELSVAFPLFKVTQNVDIIGVYSVVRKVKIKLDGVAFMNAVLDALGSQGWEAYAVEGKDYYFKRKL